MGPLWGNLDDRDHGGKHLRLRWEGGLLLPPVCWKIGIGKKWEAGQREGPGMPVFWVMTAMTTSFQALSVFHERC